MSFFKELLIIINDGFQAEEKKISIFFFFLLTLFQNSIKNQSIKKVSPKFDIINLEKKKLSFS